MEGLNTREIVERPEFMASTDALLAQAVSPEASIQHAYEAARIVQRRIAAIHGGQLIVQPPLSPEQLVNYESRSGELASVAAKGIAGIRQAETSRQKLQATTTRQRQKRSFFGSGSSAKS